MTEINETVGKYISEANKPSIDKRLSDRLIQTLASEVHPVVGIRQDAIIEFFETEKMDIFMALEFYGKYAKKRQFREMSNAIQDVLFKGINTGS